VAARSIVIPLDYRSGTELASFGYHLPHTFAHSLPLYYILFVALSFFVYLIYLEARSFVALFFTLANHPTCLSTPSILFLYGGTGSWLVKRVRGFLLFLIYQDRELGTIDALSSNLHVSYHPSISPSYCNYARTGE